MKRRASSTVKTSRPHGSGCIGWLMVPLLLVCAALLLPLASVLPASAQTPEWAPYSLLSVLNADYSSEPILYPFSPLDWRIIQEIILDQDSQADGARLAAIEESLLTPVPTITPRFPMPATSEPQAQPTAVPTLYGHPWATAVMPWEPDLDPTKASGPGALPTATYRPAAIPYSTPPPPSKPKSTRPAPQSEPTQAPVKPADPPSPTKPPNPYPQPDPDEPRPNPYP